MQFYSGEQALNKLPPNYILHQQGVISQLPNFVGGKGSMAGLSVPKQAILYQNQLLQSNISSLMVSQNDERALKLKSGKNPQ